MVKADGLVEPPLPFFARQLGHAGLLGNEADEERFKLRKAAFRQVQAEVAPARAWRWHPIVGKDHRHPAHLHGFIKPVAGWPDAGRAEDEPAVQDGLGVCSREGLELGAGFNSP